MSPLRQLAAATLLIAGLGAAATANAFVYTEQGDAGGRTAPQATIGSGPLGEIKGTIGELLPASQLHDLIDAFTFKFIADSDPTAPGLLLLARLDIAASVLLLPAVQLTLLDEFGNELAEAQGDGSVRISFGLLLPAVRETIFHIELELLEELGPPYSITFASTTGTIAPVTDVPAPESFLLLGAALIALGMVLRRS
jgi:hypothetical protein